MMVIKAATKKIKKAKWIVENKNGVKIASFQELYQAIDFVVNKKYLLN